MNLTNSVREIERHWAERINLNSAKTIPQAFLHHCRLDSEIDAITGNLIVSLETYLWGMVRERLRVYHQWPKDWWQAFRERWFPAWWLKRWPVKYETLHIDRPLYSAVCPHLDETPRARHLEWMSCTHKAITQPSSESARGV